METMKKSFFFAAVAAMFMVSCKQVEIDSEAGKLSQKNEGQTVIGAEIVESKTVLGAADENVYPINWQAGDAISVNGVTSNALTSSDFSGKTATFTLGDKVTSPYWAVYPASAAGTFGPEGADVTVPAVQGYVAGSFDPDAAIMLGTGTEGISFVNAMAYIKVKTTGTEKISNVVVTSLGAEAMSGDFTTADFTAIAPKEGGNTSTSVVLVTETPVDAGTDLIVAIPAQTYASGFMISIQSPDGKVYQKKSEKSFAAAAGHMYAVTLEYAPVAPVATLTIDGDVTDWATVPAVTYTLPKGDVMYTAMKKLKATSDDDFVYLYFEFDDPNWDAVRQLNLMIDADGNPATGGIVGATQQQEGGAWVPPYTMDGMGMEYYFEHWLHDGTQYNDFIHFPHIYKFNPSTPAGQSVFGNLIELPFGEGNLDDSKIINKGNIIAGTGYMEMRLSREFFGILDKNFNVGYKLYAGNTDIGLLPQGAVKNGSRTLTAMAAVAMVESSHKPQPEPVEPIAIDGDFSDWATAEGVQTCTLPSGALLTGAKEMKFVSSEDYVYVYFKGIDDPSRDGCVLDFYMDTDANPETGFYMKDQLGLGEGNLYTTKGIDWYVQTGLYVGHEKYYNFVKPTYFLQSVGGDGLNYGGGAVTANMGSSATIDKSYGAIVNAGSDLEFEWQLSREFLGMTGKQARFGIRYMCPGYTNCGVLPQGVADGGNFVQADMFTVNLVGGKDPEPKPVEPIEIDGEFDDWEDAASCIVPEDAKHLGVNEMRVTASGRYVYIMFDFAHDNRETNSCAFDFFIDADANGETGFYVNGDDGKKLFEPCGIEWYIETNTHNGANYHNFASIGYFLENNGPSGIAYAGANCINHNSEVNAAVSLAKIVESGAGALMEWKLDRKLLKLTGTKAAFGVKYMCPGWTLDGVCPQASASNGEFSPAPMFEVTLPAYAE